MFFKWRDACSLRQREILVFEYSQQGIIHVGGVIELEVTSRWSSRVKNIYADPWDGERERDEIAVVSMEIVRYPVYILLYILAFPAFVTPSWYCRQKIRYRFVPLLANLYPLITLSLVYNTRDCNLDNIVCFAFVAWLQQRRIEVWPSPVITPKPQEGSEIFDHGAGHKRSPW